MNTDRIEHSTLTARTEDRAQYAVTHEQDAAANTAAEDEIIARALAILESRMATSGVPLTSPGAARDWVRLKVGTLPHEEFGCIWLNSQNQVISAGQMFRGTLTQTSVYQREVVKEALRNNASAVILYHNHPSGHAAPSNADEILTRNLKEALKLVDVRVLDHFVVTAAKVTSFAEKGLM